MCNLNDKIKETTIYRCYGNPHSPTSPPRSLSKRSEEAILSVLTKCLQRVLNPYKYIQNVFVTINSVHGFCSVDPPVTGS